MTRFRSSSADEMTIADYLVAFDAYLAVHEWDNITNFINAVSIPRLINATINGSNIDGDYIERQLPIDLESAGQI